MRKRASTVARATSIIPEISEVELFGTIKMNQPDLPVVLMTAYSADDLVKAGLEEAIIAILTKPLDFEQELNVSPSLRTEHSDVE